MKLLVGTPLYNNQIDSRTVSTFLDILKESQKRNVSIDWDRPSSCLLSYNRNLIAWHALRDGFDWLLFIDADMEVKDGSFPFEMIEEAYRLDASILGVPVRLKNQENKKVWNVCYKTEKGYLNLEADLPTQPVQVDVVGTGISLINVSLFKEIPPPWFEQLDTHHESGPGFFPEDFYFCEKIIKIGKKVFVYPKVKTIHWGQWGYQ